MSHFIWSSIFRPNVEYPCIGKSAVKIDNVMWVNIVDVECDHWKVLPQFHNLKEFEKLDLDCMPIPFNHPDLIVFEEIYSLKLVSLARQAKKTSGALRDYSAWQVDKTVV